MALEKRHKFLFFESSTFNFKNLLWVLILSLCVSLFVSFLAYLFSLIIPIPENSLSFLDKIPRPSYPWKNPDLLLMYCFLPAFLEEFVFRCLLLNLFSVFLKPWNAVILTAIFFSLSHQSIWYFPFYLLLGIYFGWLMMKYNNLVYPALAHFLNNALALTFLEMSR